MQYSFTSIIKCPNNGCTDLIACGSVIERDGKIINLSDNLRNEDDIIEGMVICLTCSTAYPIHDKIAIMLADSDADINFQVPLLENMISKSQYSQIIKSTISRLKICLQTEHGKWNRDEMRYYDKEVATVELRYEMIGKIKNIPVWRIFLPRERHLISQLINRSNFDNILEIGSGNSRTIYKIFNPIKYNYSYTGTDISFKRLQVAKTVVPVGNFVQCSAMNLPFKENNFSTVISFGMLHHLPEVKSVLKSSTKLLKKNGLLLFHEPIQRPLLKFPGINKFKKVIATYEHSEHDSKININEIKTLLNNLNYTQVSLIFRNSTFRAFTESIYNKLTNNKLPSKFIVRCFEVIDLLFLKSVCRIIKSLGPGSVYGIYKRID